MDPEVTYFGSYKVPLEVYRLITILPLFSAKTIKSVIALVKDYMLGPEYNVYDEKILKYDEKQQREIENLNNALEKELNENLSQLKKKAEIEHAKYALKTGLFSVLFTGFYSIIRECIRHKMSDDDFKKQLIQLKLDEKAVLLLHKLIEKK